MSGGPGEDGKRAERTAVARDVDGPAHVPDFGSFLRQVFADGSGSEPAAFAAVTQQGGVGVMRRDYETAFNLLQRASDSFPVLLRQCQQLEAEVRRVRADLDAEVRAARGDVQQWQQVAVALKMHLDESEHQNGMLRKRLAAAEERLTAGQNLAHAAEQQASLAIGITTLFHDKIVDAFGVGSPAHAALDAIAQGAIGQDAPDGGDH